MTILVEEKLRDSWYKEPRIANSFDFQSYLVVEFIDFSKICWLGIAAIGPKFLSSNKVDYDFIHWNSRRGYGFQLRFGWAAA